MPRRPHALTTSIKRCEPANTGSGRCCPAHTKQGCLSSGVAGVALVFPLRIPKPSKIIENHTYYHAFHEFLSRLAYNRARFRGNPRTKARRESIDLDDGESQRSWATSRTSVPTLPSRAHPQDDMSRQATPSNYYLLRNHLQTQYY